MVGTRRETRTPTPLRAPVPETGVSTDSTSRAYGAQSESRTRIPAVGAGLSGRSVYHSTICAYWRSESGSNAQGHCCPASLAGRSLTSKSITPCFFSPFPNREERLELSYSSDCSGIRRIVIDLTVVPDYCLQNTGRHTCRARDSSIAMNDNVRVLMPAQKFLYFLTILRLHQIRRRCLPSVHINAWGVRVRKTQF